MSDSIVILCDRADDSGGTERNWATVIPALLERGTEVKLLARSVGKDRHFGVPAIEIR